MEGNRRVVSTGAKKVLTMRYLFLIGSLILLTACDQPKFKVGDYVIIHPTEVKALILDVYCERLGGCRYLVRYGYHAARTDTHLFREDGYIKETRIVNEWIDEIGLEKAS